MNPLEFIWFSLPDRLYEIGQRRAAGETLESIGNSLGLSRERVRQLEKTFETQMLVPLKNALGSVELNLEEGSVISIEILQGALKTDVLDLITLSSKILGLKPLGDPKDGLFVNGTPSWIREIINKLPLLDHEFFSLVPESSRGSSLQILQAENEVQWIEGLGVARKRGLLRDWMYLSLLKTGAPMDIEDFVNITNESTRNIKAHLDRDNRFVRNFAEGKVALAEWRLERFDINSGEAALIAVLSSEGPQKRIDLVRKAILLYPLTTSRYVQVLESKEFGTQPDGRYDLISRGATPQVDSEPKLHPAVKEYSATLFSVQVPVNLDVLRGAGVPSQRRLGWLVGLRRVGDFITFTSPEGCEVTVKRFPGNVSLSSLRKASNSLALKNGCALELAFELGNKQLGVRAVCECHWLMKPSC